jgi:hypothetical protein
MNGVHTSPEGHIQQLGDNEIGLSARITVKGVRLIGKASVWGIAVAVGIHGYAGKAGVAAGPDYPDRDLTPVCDEDLADPALLDTHTCSSLDCR